jgi:Flp pilus assembly protein TadD
MNNGLMAAKTSGELLGTNFVILGKYLWLLICPSDLTWDYSFNQVPIVTFANWKALLALALYLGMGIYTVRMWKIKNVYVFAILFYLITLFLSSNLVFKIGATMGERFLYVPSLGFCIALVFIVLRLFKTDPRSLNWSNKSAVFTLFGVLFLLYGFKTFDRNKVWKNNFELFSSGLEVSTGSARAHYAIASEVRVRGEAEQNPQKRVEDFRQSVEEYQKGIAIYPDDPEVWYNLGVTYYDMGDSANARKVYAKALELRPGYNMALNNTGVLYFNQKNYPKALSYFSKIVETDTAFTDAYGNIGAAYHNMGDYKTAARYYEKALAQNPNNKSTLNNISMVYKALGDTVRANSYLQKLSTLP